MDDTFKIYVDQLRKGHERTFHEQLPAEFMDVHEKELSFEKPIQLDGSAYLAENELILHWDIKAEASIACRICNEKVPVSIHIEDFYHSEDLDEIKGAVFNYKDILRETILLETPLFAECEGACPKRGALKKYLKEEEEEDEGYRPFADLDLK